MPNTAHPSAEASSHDVASDSRAEQAEHGSVPASAEHGDVPARGRPHGALDSEPRVRRVYADAGTGSARLPEDQSEESQILCPFGRSTRIAQATSTMVACQRTEDADTARRSRTR